jgi:hypothetical protein
MTILNAIKTDLPEAHASQALTVAVALTLLVLVLVLVLAGSIANAATIYKCTQPDGRTEYSNVTCGPDEGVEYITDGTFSVMSRGNSAPPPLSNDAIYRQQRMAGEAEERKAAATRAP